MGILRDSTKRQELIYQLPDSKREIPSLSLCQELWYRMAEQLRLEESCNGPNSPCSGRAT